MGYFLALPVIIIVLILYFPSAALGSWDTESIRHFLLYLMFFALLGLYFYFAPRPLGVKDGIILCLAGAVMYLIEEYVIPERW